MKKIYIILGITVVLALLICSAFGIANRGTIKFSYTKNLEQNTFTAVYPDKVSAEVIAHISHWASQAVQKSGCLPGTLRLKFANGISCRVHAKGRNVEIIADRADNDSLALANLKNECNAISGLILANVNKSPQGKN